MLIRKKRPQRRKRRFHPKAGAVYRTRDFATWTANPTRLAQRLVKQGALIPLASGLYGCPRPSRFGAVPPASEEVLRAFLDGGPFVFTGPEYWNALGLGATVMFPLQLVYNTKRSGEFTLGGQRYLLRRVKFPRRPTPEWYAIDLVTHRAMVGLDLETLRAGLQRSLRQGALNAALLRRMAEQFGTKETQQLIDTLVREVVPTPALASA
jgi:hypothetical protein